jgi:hypothetical protein
MWQLLDIINNTIFTKEIEMVDIKKYPKKENLIFKKENNHRKREKILGSFYFSIKHYEI